MPLTLRTIEFNHDPISAVTSAMNIRRNQDFEVPVPEYDSAIPGPATESCAAYSIADTARQNVVIRVTFEISAGDPTTSYDVGAKDGGIMGELAPVNVTFAAGATTATVDFPLSARRFAAIGVHDISWRWQAQSTGASSDTWDALATTSHRIYLVLAVPDAPWTQDFADKRNPWTDLLDESCARSAGAKTDVAAARKLVRAINSAYSLRYDIIKGNVRYGFIGFSSPFALSRWIDYVIRGNAPADPRFCPESAEEYPDFLIVNCNDCAASLALMAKVVGAPLEYFFHEPFGYLHYVKPIGRGKCNNPFYGCSGFLPAALPPDYDPRSRFANHTYTKLPSGMNFDACLKEVVSPLLSFFLILVWLIFFILSFGTMNLEHLLDSAGGWLVNISQASYEAKTNDKSQPFEAGAAGGTPVLQPLQFQVT
jgi:hypothetical protein